MKTRFISLLLFILLCILFISSCSNSGKISIYSSNSLIEDDEDDYGDEEETDNDNNAEWGEIEDIDSTDDIDDIDKLDLWDIKIDRTLSFLFEYEGQEQNYKIVAPETGNYRFSFNIDNVNKCYGYKIYSSDHNVIYHGDNGDDVTAKLKKGEKYAFQIYQKDDLPKASISLGIPKPLQELTDNVISDTLEYIDQEDNFTFIAEIEGVYGIELISNNVQFNYNVTLFDTSNNDKLNSVDSPSDGRHQVFLNEKLEQDKKYKIVVSVEDLPETEFKYTLKINAPQKIQSVETSYITDIFTFGGQQNEYLFNISKSAEYQVLVNDYKEPMEYKVIIYDNNRDEKIKEFRNHDNYIMVELSENIEYKIEVQQEEEYGQYYFEFVENNYDD